MALYHHDAGIARFNNKYIYLVKASKKTFISSVRSALSTERMGYDPCNVERGTRRVDSRSLPDQGSLLSTCQFVDVFPIWTPA
jgi:hypothetical protein